MPIELENVAMRPAPGCHGPSKVKFSGDHIVFLHSPQHSLATDLFYADIATGTVGAARVDGGDGDVEETISPEEQLRRERARQLAVGVWDYAFSDAAGHQVVIAGGGSLHLQRGAPDAPFATFYTPEAGEGSPIDVQFSKDGAWVSFLRDNEIFIKAANPDHEMAGLGAIQVTTGAAEAGVVHGAADFIAGEEFDRYTGYWWSPDSTSIAFIEYDERHIPEYTIPHQGKSTVMEETHRYPFPGARNVINRLAVVAVPSGDLSWLDLGPEEDIYVPRVHWTADGCVIAEVLNRTQTRLDLVRFDPAAGNGTREAPLAGVVIHTETAGDGAWLNIHSLFHPLPGGGFLFASEATGYMHLQVHAQDGSVVQVLTAGEWMVTALAGVDTANGVVYFVSTEASPLERHLYAVPLAGGDLRRITQSPGMHTVAVSPRFDVFVDVTSSTTEPVSADIRALADGELTASLGLPGDPRLSSYRASLPAPDLVEVEAEDGTLLHMAVYRPDAAEFGDGPYPTIVSVYGGPGVQYVNNSFSLTAQLRIQALRERGYLILRLDNRGSKYRGVDFEKHIRYKMGTVEVTDQVTGVQWGIDNGLVQPDQVGVFGWSYGGYMSLMCLAQAPDTFACGVSGAPVTTWAAYDTGYTERFCGLPQEHPEAYDETSVMHYADGMRGALLLIHGMIDENVHFRHSAMLINTLMEKNIDYELLAVPDARHHPRKKADANYIEHRIFNFFKKNLGL